jgi:hypothetical protein
MIRRKVIANIIFGVAVLLTACSDGKREAPESPQAGIDFTVERAPEWTELFKRGDGWFGGDGIFAIPTNGQESGESDSVLFVFSDTMFGQIVDGKLQPGYTMLNNSVMILRGEEADPEKASFLVNEKDGQPNTLFVPQTPERGKDDYYWLGDGFVNTSGDGTMYIFAYRIRNTDDGSAFPFVEVGNSLIAIPKGDTYPFSGHRQLDLPFSNKADSLSTSFGVGVTTDQESSDGYIYVYGVRGKSKELVAARVKPNAVEQFSSWEFFNGNGWGENPESARAISDSVSNELSVSPIGNGKFALVYQYAGLMPTIYMQIGESPVGPFGPRLKVWNTADDIKEPELFTYNAKAHPAISKPGELLVSYNVNSFKFHEVIESMPNLYRPRFIRILFNDGTSQKPSN